MHDDVPEGFIIQNSGERHCRIQGLYVFFQYAAMVNEYHKHVPLRLDNLCRQADYSARGQEAAGLEVMEKA